MKYKGLYKSPEHMLETKVAVLNHIFMKYRLRLIWFGSLYTAILIMTIKMIHQQLPEILQAVDEYGIQSLILNLIGISTLFTLVLTGITHARKKKFPGLKAVLVSTVSGVLIAILLPIALMLDFTTSNSYFAKTVCGVVSIVLMPVPFYRTFWFLYKRIFGENEFR